MPETGVSPSRDPDDYSETDHFRDDVLDGDMRFVDRDMVYETIRDGHDYHDEGGPGKVRRKLSFDGVLCVVVLPMDEDAVVTAWTEVGSWPDALASDRWSREQLKTIQAFTDYEHKR